MTLLSDIGIAYLPLEELLAGPVQILLDRIEILGKMPADDPQVPSALGALEFPKVSISKTPAIIEEINRRSIAAKNARQLSQWRNKYLHAAKSFKAVVGDKPVMEITEQDAIKFRKFWLDRRDEDEITTNHAVKRLRFVRQLIEAYYERFSVPPSQQKNPFKDVKIGKVAGIDDEVGKKLALPAPWVKKVIIDQIGLDGLNPQARDIATVAAECGSRQTEVYDMPPGDIHLDHVIPHLQVKIVVSGEYKRQLKNAASKRPVILLGSALEAMRRNPSSFPNYRGKAGFSGTVNKYFNDNQLVPKLHDGEDGKYSLGCTRHTFEDRMKYAKMPNEERAYLMGHSIGKVRGRPVYGSNPDLRMRVLYQEMVSFPTASWTPRPILFLREEIDRLATALGFRVN